MSYIFDPQIAPRLYNGLKVLLTILDNETRMIPKQRLVSWVSDEAELANATVSNMLYETRKLGYTRMHQPSKYKTYHGITEAGREWLQHNA